MRNVIWRSALAVCVAAICFAAVAVDEDDSQATSKGVGERAQPVVESDLTTKNEIWAVQGGTTTIVFDEAAMAEWGMSIGTREGRAEVLLNASARRLVIKPGSTLTFSVVDGSLNELLGGQILHLGDLTLVSAGDERTLSDLIVAPTSDAVGGPWTAMSETSDGGFILRRVKAGFDPSSRTITVRSPELRLSPELAELLGEPNLAELVVGSATIRATAQWVGGAEPDGGADDDSPVAGGRVAYGGILEGPDMTFCQLYGLYQPTVARLGDIVGLSVATTSWNIGTEDLMWFNIPDEEHPFIVMNLYRLKDDRFEQIGQSHIKHGFYALGSHQCGGPPCSYEPGHGPGNWLGTGCTDTYSAGLNAVQSGMGPKYELNPWTGEWYYPSSHMDGGHGHNPIQHRIQVHDADLDPVQNADATYYAEGYYVVLDDIDVMNSVSWKPVTVSGAPGGHWNFGMSGSGTYPNIGFALDAWTGATQTLIAEEIPVVEFQSPDGRCVLAAKVTQQTENTWHYEYALLNIDMDRQAGLFSIPIAPGTTVTNVGGKCAEHHNEPFNTADPDAVSIDNAPWAWAVTSDAVTWQTATNPVRWSTLYNFRFDADAPPTTTTSTLGLFRGGFVSDLTAQTIGPLTDGCPWDLDDDGSAGMPDLLLLLRQWGADPGGPPDFDGDGNVGVSDLLALLANWGPCP